MPTLPLTQLDERALAADFDNRAFTLSFAQPVPTKDLLLLLVRGTSLSVVPDPAISGSFIGELKNVTVRQALGLILPPLDLDYTIDGGFIRVFRRAPETRLFDINYIATERTAESSLGGDAIARPNGSYARVISTTKGDVFAELTKGVQTLLSERAMFNVDRKAGLLQVTDFPERLDRVAVYLDTVHDHVHRQVQIDARILEVELNDENAQALDWTALAQAGASAAVARTATLAPPSLTGLRVTDVSRFMAALAEQGKVLLIADPQLLALNNEPAIVRTTTESRPSDKKDRERPALPAVTLSVTAEIGPDGIVMLSLSPIVAVRSSGQNAAAGDEVHEADTLARVADGETIVVAGFGRPREVRERRNVGVKGGWFGRSTVVTNKRVELLILLTPKILSSVP
jgi:type II secretory pathway component GspD/PulD (secretin)